MFNNKINHADARTDSRIPEALKRLGEFPEIFVGEINYLESLVA
jgi:hypothetical protein